MFKKQLWLILAVTLSPWLALSQETPSSRFVSLDDLMQMTDVHNAELKVARAQVTSQEPGPVIAATLESPMLGYSQLDRGMNTEYLVMSQRFQFPVKYFKKAEVAEEMLEASKVGLDQVQWKKQSQLKSLYYSIYSLQKIIELAEANIKTVREVARTAERRYAAGTAPQYNAMRAHVELTDLQIQLLELKAEEKKLQQQLKELTSGELVADLDFNSRELKVPSVSESFESIAANPTQAPDVRLQSQILEMKEAQKSLAKWNYAPDFQVTYQKRIDGLPQDSSIFTVNMSVPLWFWSQKAQVEQAQAESYMQASRVQQAKDQVKAEVQSLLAELKTSKKTLEIYRTSLIPQSETAYTMSAAAYRSGGGAFIDVLDAEQAYYSTRRKYFASLRRYVAQLAELERWLGQVVATWQVGVTP